MHPFPLPDELREALHDNDWPDARALPARFYVDESLHDFEQSQCIAAHWQLIGDVGALAAPGDHAVAEIAGKPLLIVRDAQGQLRAFYNVCRHRGGPLAMCNGHARQLRCRYHGWTYTLSGRLRSAPEMDQNRDFSVDDYALEPVQVAQFGPLVFVRLHGDGAPLEDMLQGVTERIQPIDLKTFKFHHRDAYRLQCNWKVYMDNYLEGYHLPHVHPTLNRVLDYRAYETELSAWYSHQFSPIADAEGVYASGTAHYYCLFPNTMLNILPGRMQTNRVVPLSSNSCEVIFDYYFDAAADASQLDRDRAFSDQVQAEDADVCEAVQKGLASGAYRPGPLCVKREIGVHHFQALLRATYRRAAGID